MPAIHACCSVTVCCVHVHCGAVWFSIFGQVIHTNFRSVQVRERAKPATDGNAEYMCATVGRLSSRAGGSSLEEAPGTGAAACQPERLFVNYYIFVGAQVS